MGYFIVICVCILSFVLGMASGMLLLNMRYKRIEHMLKQREYMLKQRIGLWTGIYGPVEIRGPTGMLSDIPTVIPYSKTETGIYQSKRRQRYL